MTSKTRIGHAGHAGHRQAFKTMRAATGIALGALLAALSSVAVAQSDAPDVEEIVWKNLRMAYFGDRPIASGKDVIGLDAPYRAEDAAVVPIRIIDRLAGDDERRIEKFWLIIDNNPTPMSAQFEFGPAAESANIATRVRVNSYTYMRVVAETDDNELFMAKRFVKASGGCSAPVGRDPELAKKNMGQMRLRQLAADDGNQSAGTPGLQLLIRHPSFTGLQMDQLTRLVQPAHFVDAITVKKGDQTVFDSEMTFSLSENPSLQFGVRDNVGGALTARVHDNKDNVFTQHWNADGDTRAAADDETTS